MANQGSMPRGPRFSDFEQLVIADGVFRGVSVRAIADYLGRSPQGVRGWIARQREVQGDLFPVWQSVYE